MQGSRNPVPPSPPVWRSKLLVLVVVLWLGQILWLAWHLRVEAGDLVGRLGRGSWGEAVRLEDPFYRWLLQVQRLVPPKAAYLFLDNYEAGKEIQARYHLFPRKHILRLPGEPPTLFFHILRQYQPGYLLLREGKPSSDTALDTALSLGAVVPLNLPGPGLVYQVNLSKISGGFYD